MDFPAGISSAHVRQVFQGAADLTERRLDLHGVAATAFFLDGLTAGKDIAQVLLRPAAECLSGSAEEMYRQCLTGTIWAAVAKEVQDLPTLCSLLVNGFAVLVFDSIGRAVAFEMKTGEKRIPAPPAVEHTVKGAKDSFTETVRTNTSLLRRHLRSPFLRLTEFPVGSKSRTNVAVVWLEGVTPPALVSALTRRLKGLTVESFVTPAAVEEAVTGSRCTAFPLLRSTERTDRFAQAILGGQVGLLVDGLPVGYLMPVGLWDFLTSPEDEDTDFVSASLIRAKWLLGESIRYLTPDPVIEILDTYRENVRHCWR